MKHRSLRKRFVPQLLLIVLLLIAFMTVYHLNVTSILRDRASADGTRLCDIYIRDMDAELEKISRWLDVQFANDENLIRLSNEEPTAWLNAQRTYEPLLAEAPSLYPSISLAFLWVNGTPGMLSAAAENVDYDHYQALMEAAQRVIDFGKPFDTVWTAIPTDELCVFSTVIKVENVLISVLVEPEALLSSMPFYDESNQHFVLAKQSGYIVATSLPAGYGEGIDMTGDLSSYYITGERRDVIVCGAQSKCGPFRLMMVTKDAEIQAGLQWTQWVLLLVIALSVAAIVGVLASLKRNVLAPLDKTTRAIRRFGETQGTEPLAIDGEAQEFTEIYTAFNTMTEQIKELKISNYEQVIHKQQAELRFYQTQIKPHFILNCLTTINNLAVQHKTEALERFIADFSGFARCMFKNDYAPVKVAEELKQVDFYIGMQSIRYPNRIFYLPEATDTARDALIPAMLIQTLVENSIKHGMDEHGQLSVFVKCELAERLLTISVEDNGCGFSGTALEAINSGSSIGFGLRNLQTTLELLYGDRAKLTAQNVPGSGARVTAVIPQEETNTSEN